MSKSQIYKLIKQDLGNRKTCKYQKLVSVVLKYAPNDQKNPILKWIGRQLNADGVKVRP